MTHLTPKQRVFEGLRFIQEILDAGEGLEGKRYEITRNIKNALSWESELVDVQAPQKSVEQIEAELWRILAEPLFKLVMPDGSEVTLDYYGRVTGIKDDPLIICNNSIRPIHYLIGEIIKLDRRTVADEET